MAADTWDTRMFCTRIVLPFTCRLVTVSLYDRGLGENCGRSSRHSHHVNFQVVSPPKFGGSLLILHIYGVHKALRLNFTKSLVQQKFHKVPLQAPKSPEGQQRDADELIQSSDIAYCNVSQFQHNTVFLRSIFLVSVRHRPSPTWLWCAATATSKRYIVTWGRRILTFAFAA